MAFSVTESGRGLQPTQLADDFAKWYTSVSWSWKPKTLKPMKSAQRASSKGRSDNIQLMEAEATVPAHAPSEAERPLLQMLPYFEVRRSEKGGYGAFALQDLPKYLTILSEPALIRAKNCNLQKKYQRLSAIEQEEYLKLASFDKISKDKIEAIFKTNRFETCSGKCAIFPIASRFNHSCRPPCSYYYDQLHKKLVITVEKHIKKGAEITVSYGQTGYSLYHNYGFICSCGECVPWCVPPDAPDHSSTWEQPKPDEWATCATEFETPTGI